MPSRLHAGLGGPNREEGKLGEAISSCVSLPVCWPLSDCFVTSGLPAIASLRSLRRGGRAPRNDFVIFLYYSTYFGGITLASGPCSAFKVF